MGSTSLGKNMVVNTQKMPWLLPFEKKEKKKFTHFLKSIEDQGFSRDVAKDLWYWGGYELDIQASKKLKRKLEI